MKMAKPTERDIYAAGELMQVLDAIDERWGGPWPIRDAPQNLPEFLGDESFDSEDYKHLQVLYNHLARLLRTAPNFHGRVLGGMCYVICWDHNRILDPGQDVLDLHPDLRAGLDLLAEHRADFFPRLERESRAAGGRTREAAAARPPRAMGGGAPG